MVLYQKFGEWTLIEDKPVRRTAKNVFYRVQCSCGAIKEVSPSYLKKGESTRCRDCANKLFRDRFINPPNKPFKYRSHPTNNTWRAMIQRCTNPNNNRYYRYGGRGITVCDRWLESFENFYQDMGLRPKGTQLDRIDNNGPYCKENCRWVTIKENCNNRNLRAILNPGDVLNNWTVIGLAEGYKIQHYYCVCLCGNKQIKRMATLKENKKNRCMKCPRSYNNH